MYLFLTKSDKKEVLLLSHLSDERSETKKRLRDWPDITMSVNWD